MLAITVLFRTIDVYNTAYHYNCNELIICVMFV